ncbi:Organic cation transporter 1 [Nymphon striatum]|nr:Organic cation transporter 1 [Nymphon striatum]KAG1693181.1 Organic cation transporter 1 [Nymphon striatum]
MEVCCSRQRTILGNFASTGFALGFGAFAGIAYFVRDWQYLTLIASAPIVILFIYACFLSESPLWLISQGQVTEAKEVILKIAKMNNIKNIDEAKLKKILHKHQEDLETETKSSVSLIDVFYTPNMRKKTLIMYFIWLVNALVYYGLTVNVGDLNGNVYIHFTLSGIVELPAYLLTILVMLKFGKRSPTSCAFFIGGISLLLTLIVPKKLTWLLVTLSMIGKFGISASFVMTYVYSSELFPTVIRNIGIGSSSMIGRLGSIASPFISDLGNSSGKFIPPTLYGVSALIAGLLVLLLPETQNMDLPETLEEGEEFGRKVEPDKNVEMQMQSPSV